MRAAMLLRLSLLPASAMASGTFCNPLNLDYRFSMVGDSHREAADPTMVVHDGTYWLFASKSGGYWYSTDMNSWTLVEPTGLPLEDYAPMVIVMRGKFYYTAFNTGAMYVTDDPKVGNWERVADMKHYEDPGLFVDDDSRVYMYAGCSDNGNIRAVELDNMTWSEIGAPVDVVFPDHKNRGFEVGGDNNELLDHTPWVEGAFMNKIDGRYFLQYAVPGTQFKSYADGLFVGDSPMGPFEFQAYSPMSSKPTGFAAGAGHGSTYQDNSGAYWHIATSTISVRHMFERRLGIYPVLNFNGRLWVDSYLGDYPHALQGADSSSLSSSHPHASPQWMLLGLNGAATASSGQNPGLAFNEDIRTWWTADTGEAGEWLRVDLGGEFTVNMVQMNFADEGCDIVGERPAENDVYRYFVEYCSAGAVEDCEWKPIEALNRSSNTRDMPHDYVELSKPLSGVTHMRVENIHMPGGARFSISGFRIFGLGHGDAPAAIATDTIKIERDAEDLRRVTLSWPEADGAEFYVIRYGPQCIDCYSTIHSYNVYESTTAELNSLVAGYDYDYVIDAVNSNGVTLGTQSITVI